MKNLLFSVVILWITLLFGHGPNYNLAEAAKKRGDYKGAIKYTLKQLDADINTYGENAKEIIITYSKLGYYSEKTGAYEEALKYSFKALEVQKKCSEKEGFFL